MQIVLQRFKIKFHCYRAVLFLKRNRTCSIPRSFYNAAAVQLWRDKSFCWHYLSLKSSNHIEAANVLLLRYGVDLTNWCGGPVGRPTANRNHILRGRNRRSSRRFKERLCSRDATISQVNAHYHLTWRLRLPRICATSNQINVSWK